LLWKTLTEFTFFFLLGIVRQTILWGPYLRELNRAEQPGGGGNSGPKTWLVALLHPAQRILQARGVDPLISPKKRDSASQGKIGNSSHDLAERSNLNANWVMLT